MKTKIKPPLLYQVFMLVMIAVFYVFPNTRVIRFPFSLVGILVFVFGANVALSAKKAFKSTDTPMMPSEKAGKLHRDGYFRFTRNPMYLGIAVGLLGFALIFSSYINFLFPFVFVLLLDRYFIPYEEEILTRAFGQEYLDYKAQVRRWI